MFFEDVTSAIAFPGCRFVGPALPGGFADTDLLREMERAGLGPAAGPDPLLRQCWRTYRKGLADLQGKGSEIRVRICVLLPLVKALGYARINESPPGGYVLSGEGVRVRAFCTGLGADPEVPHARAQQVLAATGEQIALVTNGHELRLVLRRGAPRSYVALPLGDHAQADPPPWYLLLHGLCAARTLPRMSALLALVNHRKVLQQQRELVPRALESFLHFMMIHPANRMKMFRLLHGPGDPALLQVLFQEGARLMSRLLVALVSGDAARLVALGPRARALVETDGRSECRKGRNSRNVKQASLERALRELLGAAPGELRPAQIQTLALAPTLWGLRWGDRAAAYLIDELLGGQQPAGPLRYDEISLEEAISLGGSLSELEPDIARQALFRAQPGQDQEEIPPGRLYLRGRRRASAAP